MKDFLRFHRFFALRPEYLWCIIMVKEGGSELTERFETMKMAPLPEGRETASDILAHVYRALQGKGYDPITQLVGFVLTGDPTYITSFQGARSLICRLERDEILEELVRYYVENKLNG